MWNLWTSLRRVARAVTVCLAVAGCNAKVLDVPGRYQYDDNNGYCGEVTVQQLMLPYGAWIPQEVARSAGGGELLLGVNYDAALDSLRIRYDEFTGRGYDAFVRWAKSRLARGQGVVTVAYIRGGPDSDYDHIMPIVGFKGDSVYVNTGYSEKPVRRNIGSYSCTRHNKKDPIEKAGCVPEDTRWGYALKGPVYASKQSPTVELTVRPSREPGLGRSATMHGRIKVRGLTPSKTYTLHRVTSLRSIPRDVHALDGDARWVLDKFKAADTSWTRAVTFQSRKPAYFIVTGT